MATQLKTKPGINGANVLSIPTEWDPSWFRHFIHNSLKGADVRNAVGTNGITVTGNISSPYATISGGGSGSFTAPIVINSTAGQVSLTINGATGQNALVVNGPSVLTAPVTINSTAGTVSLTVNGAAGQEGAIFNGGAGGDAIEALGSSTSGSSFGIFIGAGTTAADYALKVQPKAGGINYLVVTGNGTSTFSANSGSTIVVNGLAGQEGAVFNGGVGGDAIEILGSSTSGSSFGLFIEAGTTSADYAVKVQPHAGGANYLQIKGDGSGTLGPSGLLGLSWDTIGQLTATPSTSATSAITVSSPNGGPWALQITRVDLANTIQLFNSGGVWFFNEPINAPSYQVSGVAVSFATIGTFTGSITGCSAAVTGTCHYTIVGTAVILYIPAMAGTSTSTAMTMTGLPAAIQPATGGKLVPIANIEDNSTTSQLGGASITGGTITFSLTAGTLPVRFTGAFTGAAIKGIGTGGTVITYDLT